VAALESLSFSQRTPGGVGLAGGLLSRITNYGPAGALVTIMGKGTQAQAAELEGLRFAYEDQQVKNNPRMKKLVLDLTDEFKARLGRG
jgi:hypothetical protein